MIKTLELKFFRKHEDLKVDFTSGLNVVRGPNEVGKTTLTEGILYALYGAAALVDTLAEVVTWGHKENDLKVKLVISVSNVDYVFTRSKAGAECNYAGPDSVVLRVTGQKEVTSFAATLLGADAKTAGVLMLASQAGLRGALDEGPTAVSSLMGKLADFEMVDRLLESASQTLSLGSALPLTTKLNEAENEVLYAKARQIDPYTLVALDEQIATATAEHTACSAAADLLEAEVAKADAAKDEAVLNNATYTTRQRTALDNQIKLDAEKSKLDRAVVESRNRPANAEIEAARAELVSAKNHAAVLEAYTLFGKLGGYPVQHWDNDAESFTTALADAVFRRDSNHLKSREFLNDISHLKKTLINGDGKCPTCGHIAENHSHVLERNAETQRAIDDLIARQQAQHALWAEADAEASALASVAECAKRRQAVIDRIPKDYLIFDTSVYPCRVEWNGKPPEESSNIGRAKVNLDNLLAQEKAAVQAEGRASAHRAQIEDLEKALAWARSMVAEMSLMPVEPLEAKYEEAFQAYQEQARRVSMLRITLEELNLNRATTAQALDTQASILKTAEDKVISLQQDIKTLEFNNELVKRLKSMKPLITDYLWNNILSAVSNFFSTLRGEQSIVTKDATGFKVNGRGGSLSGSTLDVLALSIRVALSKTFVPHANFMVLDEPAHGCDEVRTGNLLGFLAGVGFQQTILASHDELSEAVADNVIILGA